jgi:hypothetical protein
MKIIPRILKVTKKQEQEKYFRQVGRKV